MIASQRAGFPTDSQFWAAVRRFWIRESVSLKRSPSFLLSCRASRDIAVPGAVNLDWICLWATAAGPPHKGDDLRTAVADLKIKDMRAIITRAGLSHGDCVEKSDLRARTCEALEKTAPANELLRLADLIDHLIEGGGDDAETREARQAVRAPLIEAFEEARPVLY